MPELRTNGPQNQIQKQTAASEPPKSARFLPKNKTSNSKQNPWVVLGDLTIARSRARRGAFAKGAQNKPLNPLLELTSLLEEARDARCLFGRGPDVLFDPKSPHCAVSSVK